MIRVLQFIFILFFAAGTWGQSEGILNQLLAPGPLMAGHAKLEGKDCLKCHEAGKGVSVNRCNTCHKEIKEQIANKKGFHSIAMQTKTCIECHLDHKGRDYDSTKIDEKNFDHFLKTGYELKGKHAELKCQECHTDKRTKMAVRKTDTHYLAKSSTCISCHKKDDIHFFKGPYAQKDCSTCHSSNSWKKEITFNHNLDTKFKLVEKHSELKCNDCHIVNKKTNTFQYQWPKLAKDQCLICHQDFHKTKLSPKFENGNCTVCHSQSKWVIPKFNHEVTKFALNGKHDEIECYECHKDKNLSKQQMASTPVKNLNFTGLKSDCLACHENYHQFGPAANFKFQGVEQCLKCHDEAGWKQIHGFNHNKNTNFAITGIHEDLKCSECHLPQKTVSKGLLPLLAPTYHWQNLEQKTCEACHISPHTKEAGNTFREKKCSSCHTTEGWFNQKEGGFDHDKTRFPLTGIHKATRCAECHGPSGKQNYKFKSVETKFCIDCHNSIHVNQFNVKVNLNSCSECHTTTSFKKDTKFDHNLAEFKLVGKHKELACTDCHTPTNDKYKIKWPNYHLKSRMDSKTVEQIEPKSKFKFAQLKEQQCLTCHQDYHAGQLGKNCAQCHDEKGWKPAQFDHATQSKFALKGKHSELKCAECHKPTDKTTVFKNKTILITAYKPLKTNCVDCHQDYHMGQLGQNCTQCHVEQSWKKLSFNHNVNTRFKLLNKHAEVKCADCHKPTSQKIEYKGEVRFVTKFKPINTQCYECHKDPHKGSYGRQCTDCHTDKNWKAVKDFHKNFTLTGVHYTLDCNECHRDGKRLAGMSQNCLICHQKDDIHNGTLPNCTQCHAQQFWDIGTFRHSLTRFPLRGAHRVIDCSECHRNGVYKGLSSTCVACHLSDFQANPAPHVSGNTNCIQCHKNTFTFSGAL